MSNISSTYLRQGFHLSKTSRLNIKIFVGRIGVKQKLALNNYHGIG